jgi:gliding motility-associated-like protein
MMSCDLNLESIMKYYLIIIVLFLLSVNGYTQNITAFEYFIDTDPGVGLATPANPSASPTVADFNIPISISSLSAGFHTLYIRGKNTADDWTHTHFRNFYIVPLIAFLPTDITQIEYFVDIDPGVGLATQVTGITPSALITNLPIDITASAYTPGFHTLYVRTKNSAGEWTHTHFRNFYVVNTAATAENLVKFEYFFDADPGFDNGTAAPVAPPVPSVTNQDIFAVPSSLSVGSHTIYVRAKDSSGDWTQVITGSFLVTAALPPTITTFTPANGPIGTTVTITGTNFDATPANNIVRFNGMAAVVTASTETSITTLVPANATTGLIEVIVGGNTATSTDDFTVTSYVPAGNVVQLNGTTDLIEVPDNIALQPQSLTLEAWVNFSSSSSIMVILGKAWNQPSVGNSYAIYQGGGTLYSIINDTPMNAPWTPVINTWNHVALTYDNATQTQTLYLNGTALTSRFTPSPIQYSAGNLSIGSDIDFNNPGGFFQGNIDEVRIWNVARTEAEIQATLNEVLVGNEPGLVAYYKMDETGQGAGINVQNSATSTGAVLNGTTFGTACTPIFTVLTPTITSFTPASGLFGATVTITGTNFTGATEVRFNGTPITSFTVVSPTSITATLPTGVSTGAISITVGCNTATSAETFTVNAPNPNTPPAISTTVVSTQIEGQVMLGLLELLSDLDNDLDLSSLKITTQPTSGALAQIDAQYNLTINYKGISFSGTDKITIEACDLSGLCSQQELSIKVNGNVVVYNALSPNGDGKNDFLFLEYINIIPEAKTNKVTIYNRWGDEVFSINDYNNNDRTFKGLSKNKNELPSGTYFYKIEFTSGRKTKTGYLSLKR